MPFLEIRIDNAEIARRGLNLAEVQDVIGIAIGGRAAGLVFEGDRRFQIVVRLSDAARNNIEALEGCRSTLPQTASKVRADGPVAASSRHLSSRKAPTRSAARTASGCVAVTAEVRGRDIGSLVDEAQAKIAAAGEVAARAIGCSGAGNSRNFAAARQRLLIVVPMCFALIFLLLLGALGSARDALLVFSAVPLALTGGVVALWLRGMTFSISAAVGFIALSGVAVLNGLVMLTFIRQLMMRGTAQKKAIQPRRADAPASGDDDGAGGSPGLRADGARDRYRRRGAEAAGHGRHRRPDHSDVIDAPGAAGVVRTFWQPAKSS